MSAPYRRSSWGVVTPTTGGHRDVLVTLGPGRGAVRRGNGSGLGGRRAASPPRQRSPGFGDFPLPTLPPRVRVIEQPHPLPAHPLVWRTRVAAVCETRHRGPHQPRATCNVTPQRSRSSEKRTSRCSLTVVAGHRYPPALVPKQRSAWQKGQSWPSQCPAHRRARRHQTSGHTSHPPAPRQPHKSVPFSPPLNPPPRGARTTAPPVG